MRKQKKQKQICTKETERGQHNWTELLLNTTVTETKGSLGTEKKAYYYVQC